MISQCISLTVHGSEVGMEQLIKWVMEHPCVDVVFSAGDFDVIRVDVRHNRKHTGTRFGQMISMCTNASESFVVKMVDMAYEGIEKQFERHLNE